MSKKEAKKQDDIEFTVPDVGAVTASNIDDVQGELKLEEERSAQEEGDGDS